MAESTEQRIEPLVRRARDGDRAALEALLESVRDPIYRLALGMLWHPQDAEDAAQEILIRIITRLGTFEGRSAFSTWAYRVAVNYLSTFKRRRAVEHIGFVEFGRQLHEGLTDGLDGASSSPARRLLIEEVKIGCSQGMLQCLDRKHRLAYVLGEILEIPGPVAARALGITPAAFRKQRSRANVRLSAFMRRHCGLVNRASPCRCHRRIDAAVAAGHVDPERPLFAKPGAYEEDAVLSGKIAVEELRDAAPAVHRSNPNPRAPERMVEELRALLFSGRYGVLWEAGAGQTGGSTDVLGH